MNNELNNLMNEISDWSDKTFGESQRNPAIVYHLKKEVDELIVELHKCNTLAADNSVGLGEWARQITNTNTEFADCFMLLLDSAKHHGLSAEALIELTKKKLEINKARKWGQPDENGVVEHIREGE